MTFNIPWEKVKRIEEEAKKLLECPKVKVRKLARYVGFLQSVHLATGPIVAVMTRSMYVAVEKANSWNSFISLDDLSEFEIG